MGWSSFLRHLYLRHPGVATPLVALRDRWRLVCDLVATGGRLERAGWQGQARCERCGLDARIPGVSLDRHGRCSECRHAKPGVATTSVERLRALARPATAGGVQAVVGVSGGKDSLLTLELAVRELDLRVEAVLLDNGLLLDVAVQTARDWCEGLDVPLTVVHRAMAPEVRTALASRALVPWPCHVCFDALAGALVDRAHDLGAPLVLLGLRYTWPGTTSAIAPAELAFAPYVSAARARGITVVNLPTALGFDETRQRARLEAAGWVDPGLSGHSTNCLVPATFERAHLERLGRPHESMSHLGAEVRSGAIDRDTAIARMSGEAPRPDHAAELERRLMEGVS